MNLILLNKHIIIKTLHLYNMTLKKECNMRWDAEAITEGLDFINKYEKDLREYLKLILGKLCKSHRNT